jgi:outer membrane lipopolysaccharide assembly protein LptE/RlpB
MQKLIQLVLVVIILIITGCCFDLTHVKYVPVVMETKTPSKSVWMLTEKIDVPLESWSTTKLKSNTKWEYIGTIEQGEVYKTKDQIVTVRGSNTFEAYLVISEEKIVGFYLPIEKGFVKISKPIKINRDVVN